MWVLGFFLLSANAARGQPLTLGVLAEWLSQVEHSEAEFVETKTMSILEEPLRLEGKLYFEAPDYVRKEVTSPEYENYEISGDVVRVRGSDGTSRSLNLDRHPALRGFAEAFRATLLGDLGRLRRFYELRLSGAAEDWQLLLIPNGPAMAAHVERIEISGQRARLSSILIVDANGDQSLMRVRPTVE